jgi:hypothetical protein
MKRLAAAAAFLVAAEAAAWPLPFGQPTGNRAAHGTGSFPRWQALWLPTEAPLRWIVAAGPGRLAAVDKDGGFWLFHVARGGVSVTGRYGEAASPEAPPVAVRLDATQMGAALTGPDGRLLLWGDDALRGYDVGAPLSRLSFPVPVALGGKAAHDLLALTQDGAVVLIGGLAVGAPRIVARLDVHALPDSRITLGDLDGDGLPEAVVLSDPTDRYPHGALGDRVEAGAVSVIAVSEHGLALRARYAVQAPAVFEGLVPVLVPLGNGRGLDVLLARSAPRQGAAVVVLTWREGGLALAAEGPGFGQSSHWTHLVGAAALSGGGLPEIVAVATPHIGGVLTAYRRAGGYLVRVARTPGYSSHAFGSRNLEQALIADLDGNGAPEVVLPRRSRDALAGLELQGDRFVERWATDLKGVVHSNLLASDLDGDGLLDLAVADRRGLHVFLSVR